MATDSRRRHFLKTGVAGLLLAGGGYWVANSTSEKKLTIVKSEKPVILPKAPVLLQQDKAVKDNLEKIKNFDQTFADDIFLAREKEPVFKSVLQRLARVQKVIGYANFNLVSFDETILYARRYDKIGAFSKAELALIEEIFSFDAHKYGFFGKKVITELTARINRKETLKIPGSGHYVFQGEAYKKLQQLQKDVGPSLILTSGVRSVVKQLYLFLAKLSRSNGNLSLASRSLAPPGHSYHGIGDFDVGARGLGHDNFTARFADTPEYQALIKLKYVDIRYTRTNQVGVRYEPWHIKVV